MLNDKLFINEDLIHQIITLTLPNVILLFGIAYLLFVLIPRWIFPQRYVGGGIEQYISNILYMLAYIELIVPLMILLKIFSIFTFLASFFVTKFLFVRFYQKRSVSHVLNDFKDSFLIDLFNFLDRSDKIAFIVANLKKWIGKKVENLDIFLLFKRLLLYSVILYAIYTLGYRSFISLSNPLPDTSQFVEWVATLHKNILYADNKSPGPDFYGISIFIFVMQVLTNIDSIILFSIYPLLLIFFLLFGTYFVVKRFTLSYWAAVATLVIYALIFVGSPLNSLILTEVVSVNNPQILHFWGLQFYTAPPKLLVGVNTPGFSPYLRYMSGMAYEFASAFFLLNLFYLIRTLEQGRMRHLINYTLSLLLVFIFHGGGAIALLVPSALIALNALFSGKLSFRLLGLGFLSVVLAAILGNGWMLSILKYGLPQDIGAAAPFLDQLLGTKQAYENLAVQGVEKLTISRLSIIHVYLLLTTVGLYFLARFSQRGFYFSSFFLIPFGEMLIYFAPNIGLPKLIFQDRAADYLLLSLVFIVGCLWKIFFSFIHSFFLSVGKYLSFIFVAAFFLMTIIFVPQYRQSKMFQAYLDRLHYSDTSNALYIIAKSFRPHTWTAVGIVEDYSKALGKGYFVNVNDFVLRYDPRKKYLPIPTRYIFIFVEDIPHSYHESSNWYYRWRKEIMDSLKSWVSIYSLSHSNIKEFYRTDLVTVYEIDNEAYLKYLEKKRRYQ